jgi:hypothetical protein
MTVALAPNGGGGGGRFAAGGGLALALAIIVPPPTAAMPGLGDWDSKLTLGSAMVALDSKRRVQDYRIFAVKVFIGWGRGHCSNTREGRSTRAWRWVFDLAPLGERPPGPRDRYPGCR